MTSTRGVNYFLYDLENNLICIHRRDKEHGNTWDLFGGGLEENESFSEALVREIGEELGIKIEKSDFKIFQASDRKFTFVVGHVYKESSDLRLGEGVGYAWLSIDDALKQENLDKNAKSVLRLFKNQIFSPNHNVIIIPGLGDETKKIEWVTRFWKKYSLKPVVYSMNWQDSREDFNSKFNCLLQLIDEFAKNGDKVSLIGTSAGGSAVLNAFMQRKNSIYRVINICGRLSTGTHKGIHSFDTRTASSPAFAESIKMCERGLKTLTAEEKTRIMTVRPLFGDELVPANTVVVDGAKNAVIPTAEHVLSIGLAVTVFSRKLTDFINGPKR